MPTPRRQGSSAVVEQPHSPELLLDKSGVRFIQTYNGTFVDLVAASPTRRSSRTITGVGWTLKVDTVAITKGPGDNSQMVVTSVYNPEEDVDFPSPEGQQEIEWVEVQKKLETHPRYRAGGASALILTGTNNDLDKIEQWKNASTADERDRLYNALRTNAKEFADKLRRGEDSYVIFYPVARQMERTSAVPSASPCGVLEGPPLAIQISGYEYLKTADRIIRQSGHYEHTQEWTGAEVPGTMTFMRRLAASPGSETFLRRIGDPARVGGFVGPAGRVLHSSDKAANGSQMARGRDLNRVGGITEPAHGCKS